jgi:squalene-hopene/tetraprenyl-beta-curcumene cyclase
MKQYPLTPPRIASLAAVICLVVASGGTLVLSAPIKVSQSVVRARVAVKRGVQYLKQVQESDGSWSHYPATTALALIALQRNGYSAHSDPAVARGVRFLLKLQQPNGSICNPSDPNTALPNYNTALSLMALVLTHNAEYKPIIARGQKYLENLQFGAADGMKKSNPLYGGIGYGSDPDDHPDVSNLTTALEALKQSGVPSQAPVFQRAIVFLQRVQNRVDSNDQAWAKTGPNDGGFTYDPYGTSKTVTGGHRSMGAMTYQGMESYIYCGLNRNDPRVSAAWHWIRSDYTVTHHPGEGNTALYYYYNAMAKTLAVYGQRNVTDTQGVSHNWAADLENQLSKLQHPDGSWFNSNPRYWENQPSLVTSYTLIALSYCLHP